MKHALERTSHLAPVIVAALMLALLLTPYTVWKRAPHDAVFSGFDTNLLRIDRQGAGKSEGSVEISPTRLRLIAVPGSNPRVRLGSTPKDYHASLTARILRSEPGTTPLSLDLWQWKTGTRYSLTFGPSPTNRVIASVTEGAKVTRSEILGTFNPGEKYDISLTVNRELGMIAARLDGREAPPSGSPWVVLTNAAAHGPGYVEFVSEMVRITGGENYEFGATVKLANGYGNFKLSAFWFDKNRRLLGWAPAVGWHSPRSLGGWTTPTFVAAAPQAAAFATVVASAENSTYYMTDFRLSAASDRGVNLIKHGKLDNDLDGWTLVDPAAGVSSRKPVVSAPHDIHVTATIRPDEASDLFLARLDLVSSAQASAASGTAVAEVQDYRVVVPPQTWRGSSLWAVRVQDPTATRAIFVLFATGGLLILAALARWLHNGRSHVPARRQQNHVEHDRPATTTPASLTLAVGAAILAFLIMNALLFRLGYHLIDFNAAKLWSYIGMRYGIADVYRLSALVTTGEPWTGAAVKHSDFPYGPTMAYLFTGVGWLYRLFLANPGEVSIQGVEFAYLVKSVNLLFVVADATLIFLILRTLRVSVRAAALLAMLFLLNPAVWLVVSVWGETQPMSIFFLLLAILFVQHNRPHWTWMSLALGVLSRPQLWLPCAILGLVALRRFSAQENLSSIAWGVIAVFMMLLPLNLELAPSFVVNWIAGTLDVQTPAIATEGFEMAASLGAYNIWPLVSPLMLKASGYGRMWFPSVELLAGEWSYSQVSTLLTLAVQMLLIVYVLTMLRPAQSHGEFIPVLLASLLAVLLLRTGVSGHHFILALPLLIVARGLVGNTMYYSGLAVLTLTTFVSVAGDFVHHMQWKGIGDVWMPALYPGNNAVTRVLLNLYQTDWVITLGAVANLIVFVWLAGELIKPLWALGRRRRTEWASLPGD